MIPAKIMDSYYAVACGQHVQICTNAEEACAVVAAHPGGHYRKFPTRMAAEFYLGMGCGTSRKPKSQILAIPDVTLVHLTTMSNVIMNDTVTCKFKITHPTGNWEIKTVTTPIGTTNPTVADFMALEMILRSVSGKITVISTNDVLIKMLNDHQNGHIIPEAGYGGLAIRVMDELIRRKCNVTNRHPLDDNGGSITIMKCKR